MTIDVHEVARSLELYSLGKKLKEFSKQNKKILAFTREPAIRERREVKNIVVAFGSYDPLSIAHEALFRKGLSTIKNHNTRMDGLDELVIVTSTTHFEKKVNLQKNSATYDRIHAQEGFASCIGNVSLAYFNDPYFFNLLPALQKSYENLANIYFLVGADVMEKIVNISSYEKRGFDSTQVFEKLFSQYFIVAERTVEYKQETKSEIKSKTKSETTENNNQEKNEKTEKIIKQLVTASDLICKYSVLKKNENKIIGVNLEGTYSGLEIPIENVSSTLIRTKRSMGLDAAHLQAAGISDLVKRRQIYLNNGFYQSFVCARELLFDKAEREGKKMYDCIDDIMNFLEKLENSQGLQRLMVEEYAKLDE